MTIEAMISGIAPASQRAMDEARRQLDGKTKPRKSLGRLEDIAVQMAGACNASCPSLDSSMLVVMAADHGVTSNRVSAYPSSVTNSMMGVFMRKKAAINVLAKQHRIPVMVVNMGIAQPCTITPSASFRESPIAYGTQDFSQTSAMTKHQCLQAISTGRDLANRLYHDGVKLVGMGDMGIGNTTCASALACALLGESPQTMTGYGTGLNEEEHQNKIAVIEKALSLHKKQVHPYDTLVALGGFEIAGLCGLTLGCAAHRIPIVMDGFPTTVAALCASMMVPNVHDYLVAGHLSEEPGHRIVLKAMKHEPLLHLSMRLGEGSGAVLAMPLVMASVAILKHMGSFEEEFVHDAGR